MTDLQVLNLETQIQNLAQESKSQTNKLSLHIADADDEINRLKVKITDLYRQDDDIGNEMHTLSNAIDANRADIDELQTQISEHSDVLDEFRTNFQSIDDNIEQLDNDHHEELHQIAQRLDSFYKRLNDVDVYTKEIPQYVIMDEESYSKLKEPDATKFYFVVDKDDLNPSK